uniref:Uncharacterized protein n=1 Tax=Leersia perrieri TaxID=77586 RepID=A0A0D9V165_9ORYZ
MDPNSSFPKDAAGSRRNEDYISPLHEALRGTTAMPNMGEYGPLGSAMPLIISAPQDSTVLPSQNYSSYNPNTVPPPPPQQFPHQILPPASHVNTTIAEARLVSSGQNQEQYFPPQNFLTAPMGNYLSASNQMQIKSTESPPVTSLVQGDPFAVVHAHLNTTGVMDNGPIFENSAARVTPEVNYMASGHPFHSQNNQPFISSNIDQQQHTLLGSSSHVMHFGPFPSDELTFGPFPTSPYATWEQSAQFGGQNSTPAGGVEVPAVGSAGVTEKDKKEYKCKICPNAIFKTPQAYGGHMSYHSKKDKKNLAAGSSSGGN